MSGGDINRLLCHLEEQQLKGYRFKISSLSRYNASIWARYFLRCVSSSPC